MRFRERFGAGREGHREEQAGAMEKLRNMPGKEALVLALIAAGQLSLYVPRRIEGEGRQEDGEPTPAEIFSPEQARDALEHADANTVEVVVDRSKDGQRIIVTMPNEAGEQVEAGASLFTEVELPGSQTVHISHAGMEWAGRGYERPAAMKEGEDAILEQQIEKQVAMMVKDLERLGLQPDDVILKASVTTKGFASPEGNKAGNQQASQGRADKALKTARHALEQYGIAPEKISGTAQGMGAEGNLGEFVTELEASGTTFKATSPDGKAAEALAILKSLHNGTDTDPSHVEAKRKTIDAHRRADITIQLDHVQVVLRFPPELQKEADAFAVLAKEYATDKSQRAQPKPIVYEVPPVLGSTVTPPPPEGFPEGVHLRRIARYADQGGKRGHAPTPQTALGISSSKGTGVGRGHSRSQFGKSQKRHHTGQR